MKIGVGKIGEQNLLNKKGEGINMSFKTDMWNYVEYLYSGIEPIFHGEKPTGKLRFKRDNTSCENEYEAIGNFCFWLNNGGLSKGYYAIKFLNRIDIYKRKKHHQPERVYQFWNFEFYNLDLEYKGSLCPAFRDLNFLDVGGMQKRTKEKIFDFIGDEIQGAE